MVGVYENGLLRVFTNMGVFNWGVKGVYALAVYEGVWRERVKRVLMGECEKGVSEECLSGCCVFVCV